LTCDFWAENDKKVQAGSISFAKKDFEGVDWLAVSDTFELAIEMDGGIVWIAIFVFVGGFGLALFEGVVKVGLGEGLEGEQGKGEGGGGWVEATVVWVGGLFSSPSEALEEKCGGKEQGKAHEGPVNDDVDVHGRPLMADGSQAWTGAPNMAAAMFLIAAIRLAREEDAGRGWT
jgi:hypothetical protein